MNPGGSRPGHAIFFFSAQDAQNQSHGPRQRHPCHRHRPRSACSWEHTQMYHNVSIYIYIYTHIYGQIICVCYYMSSISIYIYMLYIYMLYIKLCICIYIYMLYIYILYIYTSIYIITMTTPFYMWLHLPASRPHHGDWFPPHHWHGGRTSSRHSCLWIPGKWGESHRAFIGKP